MKINRLIADDELSESQFLVLAPYMQTRYVKDGVHVDSEESAKNLILRTRSSKWKENLDVLKNSGVFVYPHKMRAILAACVAIQRSVFEISSSNIKVSVDLQMREFFSKYIEMDSNPASVKKSIPYGPAIFIDANSSTIPNTIEEVDLKIYKIFSTPTQVLYKEFITKWEAS